MKKNQFTAKKFGSVTDLNTMSVSEKNVSTIEFMRTGKWKHSIYGDIVNTLETLQNYKQNFENKVRKAVPIDIEHKTDQGAVGWVQSFSIEGPFEEDNQEYYKLMGEVEWTDKGRQLIKSKEYRFFSPEVMDRYKSKTSDTVYKDVVLGGAITNRPFFDEMDEVIVMSEQNLLNNERKETTMTLEEMKTKLREDRKFSLPKDASDEDKAVLTEAKAELFSETAEKLETAEQKYSELEKDSKKSFKEQEEEANKIFSELGVESLEDAKGIKKELSEARKSKIEAQVKEFALPKNVEAVTEFAMTLSEENREQYFNTLKAQGSVKDLTDEKGGKGDEDNDEAEKKAPAGVDSESYNLDLKAKKYMETHKDVSYREAVYAVKEEADASK